MEDIDRPDYPGGMGSKLRDIARGPDLFQEVGRGPRLIAAGLLAPFAAYLVLAAVLTPVAAVHFARRNEWPLVWILLGSAAGHGLVGLGLAWLTRALWRGRPSANRWTVLPTWLVGVFLAVFLTPLMVGGAVTAALQGWAFADGNDLRLATLCGAAAVGCLAGLARGWVTFARLRRTSRRL